MKMMIAIRKTLKIPKAGKRMMPVIIEIEIILMDTIMEDIFGVVRILLAIKSPPFLLYVYSMNL